MGVYESTLLVRVERLLLYWIGGTGFLRAVVGSSPMEQSGRKFSLHRKLTSLHRYGSHD